MKRNGIYFLVGFIAISNAPALETYTVKKNETLSEITRLHFPEQRIYGPRGKLKEILNQNPQIKNPDLIRPRQIIQFATSPAPIIEIIPEEIPHTPEPIKESWKRRISLFYGVKYLSFSQSGVLGDADVGVLYFNNFKLNSELTFKDWMLGLQLETYDFKYKSSTTSNTLRMNSLSLLGGYKWFVGGVAFEQNPFINNTTGRLQLTKTTTTTLQAGMRKVFQLQDEQKTTVRTQALLKYPLQSTSDKSSVEIDSLRGLGVQGQIEFNRKIFSRNEFTLYATWLTQAGFQKISQQVAWGNSQGKVETTISEASTTLGLGAEF